MKASVYVLERRPDDDIQAIYRKRIDHDWEFAACFSRDVTAMPQPSNGDCAEEMIETIVESIRFEGDDVLIVWNNEPDFPSVYTWVEGDSLTTEWKATT